VIADAVASRDPAILDAQVSTKPLTGDGLRDAFSSPLRWSSVMPGIKLQLLGAVVALCAGVSLAWADDTATKSAPADDADANPPAGIVTAETVDRIVKVLEKAGFEVEVNKADSGAPLIESTDADNPFSVHFYDCTDGKQCGTIQFESGWNLKNGINAVTIEQWNSDKIWGQAYRDKDKDPWLSVSVDLRGGVTEANLLDVAKKWDGLMSQFADFIGWEK
jgi:hypothetical protein